MEIVTSFPGGKRVDAHVEGHVICTDQREKFGGEGSAPEPFQYFLASIATCAGIYVLGFCQARDIDTSGLELRQEVDFDPKTHQLTRVGIKITTPPGFPAKYLSAVKRAANLCTVKKTILDPPAFEVVVEQG